VKVIRGIDEDGSISATLPSAQAKITDGLEDTDVHPDDLDTLTSDAEAQTEASVASDAEAQTEASAAQLKAQMQVVINPDSTHPNSVRSAGRKRALKFSIPGLNPDLTYELQFTLVSGDTGESVQLTPNNGKNYTPFFRLVGAEGSDRDDTEKAWKEGAMNPRASFVLSTDGTSRKDQKGPKSVEQARDPSWQSAKPLTWLASEFVTMKRNHDAVEMLVHVATNATSQTLCAGKLEGKGVCWQVDVDATAVSGEKLELRGTTQPFMYVSNLPKLSLEDVVMDGREGSTRMYCFGEGLSDSATRCMLFCRDRKWQLPQDISSKAVYNTRIPDDCARYIHACGTDVSLDICMFYDDEGEPRRDRKPKRRKRLTYDRNSEAWFEVGLV